jgi:hypothetical protein
MQQAESATTVHRSHQLRARCTHCAQRDVCDQAL